jgi:hypothetical protein
MPSEDYGRALEASKRHHASSKTYSGKLVRPYMPFIRNLIRDYGCRSMLDYGCGKGVQYEWVMPARGVTIEEWLGIPVTKYDPAWPPFAAEPQGKFDLVICTNTLGAIPDADIGWVFDEICGLAGKVVYVSEQCGGEVKKGVIGAGRKQKRAADWQRLLGRDAGVVIVLATKDRDGSGLIEHRRYDPAARAWVDTSWPSEVRPLDHSWACWLLGLADYAMHNALHYRRAAVVALTLVT